MKIPTFIFLFITSLSLYSENLSISSKSYLIQDMNSKAIIKEKEVNSILPIASITKLVTALISLEQRKEGDYLKVYQTTVLRNEGDKSARLKEGEFYTLKDLLLTMLVSSTNVSALTIATDISGSTEEFVNKMNEWSKNKNLKNTSFGDTFGLSPKSVSSANNISTILDLIEQNSFLYNSLSLLNYSIREKNGKTQKLSSTNEMPYYKEFRIFGKTGTTKLAGKCFAGFVTKGKNRWKIILLGSENVFGDIKLILNELDTKNL